MVSHENIITDTLKLANLEKEIFYISDKIVEIKTHCFRKKEDVKEYYIKGYFITYIFMNKNLIIMQTVLLPTKSISKKIK